MDRKKLIGFGVLIAVLAAAMAGYWYYQKTRKTSGVDAVYRAGSEAEDLGKSASQGVLPSIDPKSNPMENAPDTNPVSKTNPFSNIKTNPFSAEGGSASGGK